MIVNLFANISWTILISVAFFHLLRIGGFVQHKKIFASLIALNCTLLFLTVIDRSVTTMLYGVFDLPSTSLIFIAITSLFRGKYALPSFYWHMMGVISVSLVFTYLVGLPEVYEWGFETSSLLLIAGLLGITLLTPSATSWLFITILTFGIWINWHGNNNVWHAFGCALLAMIYVVRNAYTFLNLAIHKLSN